MFRLAALLINLIFMILTSVCTAQSAATRQIRLHKADRPAMSDRTEIRIRPVADTARTCYVLPVDTAIWRVDGWVSGSELYKSYLDPSLACEDPYPFLVTEINMPIYVAESTVVIVSIDVEDVYYASEDCPWPDSILALSADYMVPIPGEGYYDIWVPLDEPVMVHGPFFAGFFIGNTVDSSVGMAVLTDDSRSTACRSYDIWDEQIGFVDLVNNGVLEFPGRLLLYAAGIPGGGTIEEQPKPKISILAPERDQTLYGNTTIWTHELSGSNIIDYVAFEYFSDGRFVEFGRDYDGTAPIRNGTGPSGQGNGFCETWDFSHLPEGIYTLRVTAVDTLGRFATDSVTVYLEPSPPTPKIVSPADGSHMCDRADILVSCRDENLVNVAFYRQFADDSYSAGIQPLAQSDYGDLASGSVAAAMALQLWISRGVVFPIYDDSQQLTAADLVKDLMALFESGYNQGATDEEMFCGLQLFSAVNGSALEVTTATFPDYSTIRVLVQEQRQTVLLGLGGKNGIWITVDGFEGWLKPDGTYRVIACNPGAGKKESVVWRQNSTRADINIRGTWHSVDRFIAMRPGGWTVSRELIGTDSNGDDGWSYDWQVSDFEPGSRHFVRVESVDEDGFKASHTVLLEYDCSQFYAAGDYDGNEAADIVDLAYLIDFVVRKGPEPVGGAWRADANGDRRLNITDVVFYMNYLYGMADRPCY